MVDVTGLEVHIQNVLMIIEFHYQLVLFKFMPIYGSNGVHIITKI